MLAFSPEPTILPKIRHSSHYNINIRGVNTSAPLGSVPVKYMHKSGLWFVYRTIVNRFHTGFIVKNRSQLSALSG